MRALPFLLGMLVVAGCSSSRPSSTSTAPTAPPSKPSIDSYDTAATNMMGQGDAILKAAYTFASTDPDTHALKPTGAAIISERDNVALVKVDFGNVAPGKYCTVSEYTSTDGKSYWKASGLDGMTEHISTEPSAAYADTAPSAPSNQYGNQADPPQ